MDEFEWQILNSLYTSKNISKTAEKLFTTQPNITKRLKAMEKKLSVQLVVRKARGVAFTPHGEYLAQKASEVLRLTQDIKLHLHDINDCPRGTIRLAAPNSFMRNELSCILEHFKGCEKQVNFELITCISDNIPKLVRAGEIDVAFIHGDHFEENRKFHYSSEKLFVVSQNAISVNDLPHLPQINYTRSLTTRNTIGNWWKKMFALPQNIILHVSDVDICRQIVSKGLGYGFFFGEHFLEDDPNLKGIAAAYSDNTPVIRNTWMMYTDQCYDRSIIKIFVDFIIAGHK